MALHAIWKEFTDAIYYKVSQIAIDGKYVIDIPFVMAKFTADYGVGIDFGIIPLCLESTIAYEKVLIRYASIVVSSMSSQNTVTKSMRFARASSYRRWQR